MKKHMIAILLFFMCLLSMQCKNETLKMRNGKQSDYVHWQTVLNKLLPDNLKNKGIKIIEEKEIISEVNRCRYGKKDGVFTIITNDINTNGRQDIVFACWVPIKNVLVYPVDGKKINLYSENNRCYIFIIENYGDRYVLSKMFEYKRNYPQVFLKIKKVEKHIVADFGDNDFQIIFWNGNDYIIMEPE